MTEETIVKGIKLSVAAKLVENAFRKVLKMSDTEIAKLSGNIKLERYCDVVSLSGIRECIRTNAACGLPSLTPPRTIVAKTIDAVGLSATIGKLVTVISDEAYY